MQFATLVVLLLAAQFLIPSRLVFPGLGAVGRPSILLGAALLLAWVLGTLKGDLPSGGQPARWILGAWLAVQMIGYGVGFDRLLTEAEANAADRWMIFNLSMIGLALAVMDGMRSRRELDRVLRALVTVATCMAIVGVLQFLGVVDLTQYIRIPGLVRNTELLEVGERGTGIARVAGTANHYIEFGVVLALVLPLALHCALVAPRGWRRIVQWAAVVVIAGSVPLAISRSATLTVALAVLLLAVVWPWRMRYNAVIVTALSLIVFRVINPGVLGTIRALFTNWDDDPSVQGRVSDTDYVTTLWSLRPWWGRGAGTLLPDLYLLLDNQLYVSLITGGVIGLVALVLLFAGPYLMARRIRLRGCDQETRHLGQALAAIMPAGFLASGTFDSFAFATFVGVLFLTIGLIGALWRLEEMSQPKPLQLAEPGDTLVNSPLWADWRARIRTANATLDSKRTEWERLRGTSGVDKAHHSVGRNAGHDG